VADITQSELIAHLHLLRDAGQFRTALRDFAMTQISPAPNVQPTQLIAVVVMAATLCGIVHSYTFYMIFGINFFEFGARDDFILAALRSPVSLIVVLLVWLFNYSPDHSVVSSKTRAAFTYFLLPAALVAALGVGQAIAIKRGVGKLIGSPVCKATYTLIDSKVEAALDGVTPLGKSGPFMILWLFQKEEVRIINNQALKILQCNAD
jgi:hypothetical protein